MGISRAKPRNELAKTHQSPPSYNDVIGEILGFDEAKYMSKVGFGIIVFGLITILIAASHLADTLANGMCVNKILSEAISPSGEVKATVFTRSCGANVIGTNVSVVSAADQLPNHPGNVLQQIDESGATCRWESGESLVISLKQDAETQQKSESVMVWRLPFPKMVTVKYTAR